MNFSKFDFLTNFNCQIEGLVGREIQPALSDVYTKYGNKIDKFNQKIKFKLQKEFTIKYYQKNTKKNKKGDLKECYVSFRDTTFSKVVTYLAKWYNENLVNYLISEIQNEKTKKDESQIEFYASVLKYIDKFGDRLINLVMLKRADLKNKIFKYPILFKKLTYDGINTIELIAENKNGKSKLTHYVTLSGFGDISKSGKLDIPVTYNKTYHGNIKLFNKKNTAYKIQFVDNKIRIILSKKGEREYIENATEILGVDINLKHNLFSCSNGSVIDFDRELISNFVKTRLKFDSKRDFLYKTDDSELTPIQIKQKNKIIKREDKWLRKLTFHYSQQASKLIKIMKSGGFDHLSLEDLMLSDKSYIRSKEFGNLKYSALVRILHLGDFKNILTNQCSNNGIQLTIVPSHYSSQRCHKCGFVHRDNRVTQEEFKCLHCGYECNADYNASQNIKQFAEIDVLLQNLLKCESNGWYVPKTHNKYKIRKVLDDFHDKHSYDTLQNVGVGG